ncbi:MAG: hypothetical protein A2857_03345 [Candidatus Levybacteria bacterium RIFCSPHIGHO2_01_FULL_36_15]|nr:MAG: hypothetical protein A2857_03345 [Candidatus Levybacteria bacterium RIFCSPHIGHO2_01_FULL_36_15]OGH38645.1 MAG: hypothetical protein A2905_06195 [Candidatus Levybacteria bacterium RIFCSPLOWO2_01_FULL_36_10]
MNNQKIAIESLSMDLMRVALGYQRGSISMAKRFSKEAQKRCSEIDASHVKPYFAKILKKLTLVLRDSGKDRIAEDILMHSVICKNYAKKFC